MRLTIQSSLILINSTSQSIQASYQLKNTKGFQVQLQGNDIYQSSQQQKISLQINQYFLYFNLHRQLQKAEEILERSDLKEKPKQIVKSLKQFEQLRNYLIDGDDFFFIIEGMEKMKNQKIFAIKRMNTMGQAKRDEWSLPSQYHKVLLFLGLIRKAVKATGRVVKENEEKQNEQMQFLRKKYSNGNRNSFDSIVPNQRKPTSIKMTWDTLLELKKDLVAFLKEVKVKTIKKGKQTQRISTMTQQIFLSENTLPIEQQNCAENSLEETSLNSKKATLKPSKKSFGPYHPSKFRYLQNFVQTEKRNKNWINNNRFKRKIKNETELFKKFNYSLSKFYIVPDTTGTVRGSFQIFDLYISSLFETKNAVTTHFNDIISNKKQGKQRLLYEIRQMNLANNRILGLFQAVCKENQIHSSKIRQLQQRNMDQLAKISNNSHQFVLTEFIKKLALMMQATKIIINIPSVNNILRAKSKVLKELFQKLSQFRYLTTYLNVEILLISKNMPKKAKSPEKLQQLDYETRWRQMFQKKYKPIRIFHVRQL